MEKLSAISCQRSARGLISRSGLFEVGSRTRHLVSSKTFSFLAEC